MEYRVRTVRDEAGLEQLESAWNSLLERSRGGSIFASFPWNSAWWQFFGEGARLFVVVVSDPGKQVRPVSCLLISCMSSLRGRALVLSRVTRSTALAGPII